MSVIIILTFAATKLYFFFSVACIIFTAQGFAAQGFEETYKGDIFSELLDYQQVPLRALSV